MKTGGRQSIQWPDADGEPLDVLNIVAGVTDEFTIAARDLQQDDEGVALLRQLALARPPFSTTNPMVYGFDLVAERCMSGTWTATGRLGSDIADRSIISRDIFTRAEIHNLLGSDLRTGSGSIVYGVLFYPTESAARASLSNPPQKRGGAPAPDIVRWMKKTYRDKYPGGHPTQAEAIEEGRVQYPGESRRTLIAAHRKAFPAWTGKRGPRGPRHVKEISPDAPGRGGITARRAGNDGPRQRS